MSCMCIQTLWSLGSDGRFCMLRSFSLKVWICYPCSKVYGSTTLKMEATCSPKCRLIFNGLRDVISQKKELFITTTVRTSNPIFQEMFHCLLVVIILSSRLYFIHNSVCCLSDSKYSEWIIKGKRVIQWYWHLDSKICRERGVTHSSKSFEGNANIWHWEFSEFFKWVVMFITSYRHYWLQR
jgi:hypothetical protein